ncbi:hypothetical protein OS493_021059 [Desmophyllum pertusum]|uniref:Uncharacterized protein n=1 Tax=Desmophyllum pertusum TaxID=174260 RepID=A0A9X0A057_9CNID|nr:hypothetical protein OS493_021059 [Desmophyllum pertusum]
MQHFFPWSHDRFSSHSETGVATNYAASVAEQEPTVSTHSKQTEPSATKIPVTSSTAASVPSTTEPSTTPSTEGSKEFTGSGKIDDQWTCEQVAGPRPTTSSTEKPESAGSEKCIKLTVVIVIGSGSGVVIVSLAISLVVVVRTKTDD